MVQEAVKKLHSLGIASLVAQEFGHMLQYREVVGSTEEPKTWGKIQGGCLNIYGTAHLHSAMTHNIVGNIASVSS